MNTLKHHKKYLGWRILPWKKALQFWNNQLKTFNLSGEKALEVGANKAGLSKWLAEEFNMKVTATDLNVDPDDAEAIRKEFPDGQVELVPADATALPYPDNHFSVVVMKSVLVSLDKSGQRQPKAIKEIHRVLKPGGVFLFAENMKGSSIHNSLRKKFVKWYEGQQYYDCEMMENQLKAFSSIKYKTFGFFSIINKPVINQIAYAADHFIKPFTPKNSNYIIYGVAVK